MLLPVNFAFVSFMAKCHFSSPLHAPRSCCTPLSWTVTFWTTLTPQKSLPLTYYFLMTDVWLCTLFPKDNKTYKWLNGYLEGLETPSSWKFCEIVTKEVFKLIAHYMLSQEINYGCLEPCLCSLSHRNAYPAPNTGYLFCSYNIISFIFSLPF